MESNVSNEPDLSATDAIWADLEAGKYEQVIVLAEKFQSSANQDVAKDAMKLIAMALFKQGKYQDSLPYYMKATEYDEQVEDWFNVIMSATLSNNIKLGREAFDTAYQMQFDSQQQGNPKVPYMHLYYASALRDIGEFDLALKQINALRIIYEKLAITDSHFLYMRGVPLFTHAVDVAVDIFNGLGNTFNAFKWFKDFSKNLDEEGQEYLKKIKAKITL